MATCAQDMDLYGCWYQLCGLWTCLLWSSDLPVVVFGPACCGGLRTCLLWSSDLPVVVLGPA
ncbi:hypothetical protein LOK49_LG01G01307 [Camellia lanceoleosa]|uniref:Uncharacterized protein n=1 Tax=Camellia lanceoleosa TaxID=1840588 RepID=A0ACC0IV42_9ERIC|nr:hypothetical protein LOK49_LG01G01307 [Camellia lanceoleosa]